jgi:hypothetical protein
MPDTRSDPSAASRVPPWLPWLAVPGLFALGAGLRALRFTAPFHWPFHWDETQLATPALQILAGGLPPNGGVEYFGAMPSYPLAVWFAVAGSSTWALDLFAYGMGLCILWLGWRLLRRFLDPPAALFGLAVLAVPPLFLAKYSFFAAPDRSPLPILGHLCLLATHTAFVRCPGSRRALLALGLLGGLGWWTSPMVITYLAPFGVLALRTGLVLRASFWLFVVGFVVGGLPQFLYELLHFPSVRFLLFQAGSVPVLPFGERVATVTGMFIPTLLGFEPQWGQPWRAQPWTAAALGTALPLWGFAFARAIVRDRGELAWVVGRGGRLDRGFVILWIVAATNLALVLATERSINANYLLSLYAVLPCWMGEALDWLRRRRGPWLAGAALVVLLLLQGWPNWRDSFVAPENRRWRPMLARYEPLFRWLGDRGIDRAYLLDGYAAHAFEATYVAGGRAVFADPWAEVIVQHGQLVDAAVNPAIAGVPTVTDRFRASLRAIGVDVRETAVGGRRVLEPEPTFTTTFVPLPRSGWTATASDHSERAADLLDGDAASSWDTRRGQAPDQWLAVDLGAPQLVSRIDLLSIDWLWVPGGLRVDVSPDGQRWDTVRDVPEYWGPLFFSEHHAFLKVRRGRVQAIFPPVEIRHIRIAQTRTVSDRPWAARELFAYGPGGPRPPVPPPGELTAALRREGIRYVYANHWLSARVRVESRGTIGAQESNIHVNDYQRTEPDPTELVAPRLEAGHGILLGADADAAGILAMLAGQPVTVRESQAGPYRLLALEPTRAPRRLDKAGWRVTASEPGQPPQPAGAAIDGDRRTRWISREPGTPALEVTLDLGQPRELRGVEVRPGIPGRELRLWGSPDGVAWAAIEPLSWAGSIYWTGSELLRNGGAKWAVVFPPTRLRFLRLSPAGPLRDPWTIAEIDAID